MSSHDLEIARGRYDSKPKPLDERLIIVLTVEHLVFHCQGMRFTFPLSARCTTEIEIACSTSWQIYIQMLTR